MVSIGRCSGIVNTCPENDIVASDSYGKVKIFTSLSPDWQYKEKGQLSSWPCKVVKGTEHQLENDRCA